LTQIAVQSDGASDFDAFHLPILLLFSFQDFLDCKKAQLVTSLEVFQRWVHITSKKKPVKKSHPGK
jgi:hypothetical protein